MYYNIKIKLYYAYGFQQGLVADHHLFLSNKSQIEHTECVDRHTQYHMPTVFNKALLRIPPHFFRKKCQIEHTECIDRHTQYYMPMVFNKALLRIPSPFCTQKSQIEHTVGFDCNTQNSTYYRCIH